jgi:carboxyl-terminal processing protease
MTILVSILFSVGSTIIIHRSYMTSLDREEREAVDSLQKDGAKGIVIDLRDNPGGFVNSVIEMSDYLIDDDEVAEGGSTKGLLLQTKDKNDAVMDEYKCKDGHSVDIPMAVLVNGNSASASEIMAGCLKDYNKAELIGTTTYGKGIVQSVIPLSDGSAIKITIAQYFLPSGTAVHKVCVKPDKEVELDVEKYKKDPEDHKNDNQLMEAVKTLD